MDLKEMPIINSKPKENLELLIGRYNDIILNLINTNEGLPLSLYVITKTGLLAPIKLKISFKDNNAHIELDRNRLN
ncbi:MAG: hypothetical protein ACR2IS_04805 [Nitrososphaeraceae archaeon]